MPIDIYRCVKWLIEDDFTTGQIISPNGGFVIYKRLFLIKNNFKKIKKTKIF
jgi:hypothetical protein